MGLRAWIAKTVASRDEEEWHATDVGTRVFDPIREMGWWLSVEETPFGYRLDAQAQEDPAHPWQVDFAVRDGVRLSRPSAGKAREGLFLFRNAIAAVRFPLQPAEARTE